ncbi:MAG: hypothetical protein ACOYBE_12530 [Blautia sp.]|jgi:energy-coupling factor transport system substrate-specific component
MKQPKQGTMRVLYVVTMGFLSAILLLGQVGMAILPNIEPVSFLIIVYTLVYRKKVFYIIYTFVFLEGLIYGFGIWWVSYLYIWTILACIVLLMCKNESVVVWSILAGAYGLSFGFLCAIPYFITGGIGGGIAYYLMGIPYDISHCIGNTVITLVMFKPVYGALKKMHQSQTSFLRNTGKSGTTIHA